MNLDEHDGPAARWNTNGDGVYQSCGRTEPRLPAGAYSCTECWSGPQYVAKHLQVDDLIDFPDSLSGRVLREIEQFWTLGARFHQYGFLHRRGYLLHGKQGCGKSSLVHQIVAKVVTAGQVAFFCEQPQVFVRCMEHFRKVEPDRPIVCVFEDIDALIATFGDADLLQWLDGNHQVDRTVNLATTNYPERLDPRIVSRPRRFDRVLKIESPDTRLRAAYFARKLPEQSAAERARWVQLTDGLPFAALAEVVISVQCLGNDLEETVRLLKELDALPQANVVAQ
jgi:hypothetical protein